MKKSVFFTFVLMAVLLTGCKFPNSDDEEKVNQAEETVEKTDEVDNEKQNLINEFRAYFTGIDFYALYLGENGRYYDDNGKPFYDDSKKLVICSDKISYIDLTTNTTKDISFTDSDIASISLGYYNSNRIDIELKDSTHLSGYPDSNHSFVDGYKGISYNYYDFAEKTAENSGSEVSSFNGYYNFNNASGSQSNGTLQLSDGTWSYSGNKSDAAATGGTYTVSGSKITVNWNSNGYDVSETFSVTVNGSSATLKSDNDYVSTFFTMLFGVTDLEMTFDYSE